MQADFPECSRYQIPNNKTVSHSQFIYDPAIIMKNPKMANIVFRQVLPQQGVVIYEINTCITWLLPSHCFCPQL